MPTNSRYPLHAVRTLALHAQELAAPLPGDGMPARTQVATLIERLGAVQIDTLQMVQRSQHLWIWSRMGAYDASHPDYLAYGDRHSPQTRNVRRLFEYWSHAACYLPLTVYRYYLPLMQRHRQPESRRAGKWLQESKNAALAQAVLEQIRSEGAQRAADFAHDGRPRGPWWDWKPAKQALEALFTCGELMIADRVNFQRVYDLPERVLPDWVDRSHPPWAEMLRYLVEHAVRTFGACTPAQVMDAYHHLGRSDARPVVEVLLKEGVLATVRTEAVDGQSIELLVHCENLPNLQAAADGAVTAQRTTFLSPFDNLFWPQGRDRQLWGFEQTLEAYKPREIRRWGYFCLPILHGNRLVGRFDPKLERKTGLLRLQALHLEPEITQDDDLVACVAVALRNFMDFHCATDLVIAASDPPSFSDRLLAALR